MFNNYHRPWINERQLQVVSVLCQSSFTPQFTATTVSFYVTTLILNAVHRLKLGLTGLKDLSDIAWVLLNYNWRHFINCPTLNCRFRQDLPEAIDQVLGRFLSGLIDANQLSELIGQSRFTTFIYPSSFHTIV